MRPGTLLKVNEGGVYLLEKPDLTSPALGLKVPEDDFLLVLESPQPIRTLWGMKECIKVLWAKKETKGFLLKINLCYSEVCP